MTMKKREKWVVARDTTGGGDPTLSSGLKVPRHCPFVLLVLFKFNFFCSVGGGGYRAALGENF
jgi:hypothetical protein